jgi:ferric-dicitrate binding protein FerR (iron transport regulator)
MEKFYHLFDIAVLIAKEKRAKLTDEESKALQQWLAESDSNKALYGKFEDKTFISDNVEELKKFNSQHAYTKVATKITSLDKAKTRYLGIPNYTKYAAAVVLLIASAYFVVSILHKPEATEIAQSIIEPGRQKAILITSGNEEIVLDGVANKQIITNDKTRILQNGSTLSYDKSASEANVPAEVACNTLITPRGGEYSLILSDGTEVKLNAGSKLKYPVEFTGNTREVILEGEAFFKVAKYGTIPFIVTTNEMHITVYGTMFNVSTYTGESSVQTTLVEGSVGVSLKKAGSDMRLKPGEQFTLDKNTGETATRKVNTDQYIAWTKGLFVFENEPIENILRVMSRWYDFDFEFADNSLREQRFTLSLGRYDHVSKILEMISASSGVRFSEKGKHITVY